MSLQTRGRRPSMLDPIDPKELQQALYASAAAVSPKDWLIRTLALFNIVNKSYA
jgi:hypothetical protein